MTIALTGAGSLFVRLGHLFGGLADVEALRGAAATVRVLSTANFQTRIATLETDYAAGTALSQVTNGDFPALYALQTNLGSIFTDFKQRASNTLKAMYSVDVLGLSATAPLAILTQADELTAVKELIRQMTAASASVQDSTVAAGAVTAVGTPNGDAAIVVSLKDGKGKLLQLCFPETLRFSCTSDSQVSSSLLGVERMSVQGAPAVGDVFSHLWPGGSNTNATITAVPGTASNASGNLLYNSDFLTFTTTDYPDNWVVLVGAVCAQIFNGVAGTPYTTSGGALKLTGTGGAVASIAQTFNTTANTGAGTGGSPALVKPNKVYHVNGWLKVSATPAAGVVGLDLVNAGNTIINDDAGTANTVSKSLTAVSTTYVNFNGSFRTPSVLPSAVKLRVRLSTDIDSGKSVYIGRLSMTEATPLYTGGPYASVHSGNTPLINGLTPDTWTVAVTNTYGVMQQWMDRVFGLRQQNLQLPYAGSPTVADTLVA